VRDLFVVWASAKPGFKHTSQTTGTVGWVDLQRPEWNGAKPILPLHTPCLSPQSAQYFLRKNK